MTTSKALGRVAVLAGGFSAERDISLLGGRAVLDALLHQGIDAELIDTALIGASKKQFDCAFIMMHGIGGEDGSLQGYLETLNIPYTGSGIDASVLCMNKYLTKLVWLAQGVAVPDFVRLTAMPKGTIEGLPEYPLVVKPCAEGSSIGMSLVRSDDELFVACEKAFACSDDVLIEQWIDGEEFTLSMVGDDMLPVIEIKTPHTFYDYQAKYESTETQYLFPEFAAEVLTEMEGLARKAFNALNVQGWGRIDFIRGKNQRLYFLEVNTVPGMTSHSLVPKAAQKVGMSYDALVMKILQAKVL